MIITGLEKKDDSNIVIILDNGDRLVISYELLLKNGLRRNSEISESHFLFLKEENEKFTAKQQAYKILGRRLHSRNELKLKLLKKKFNKDILENILTELEKKDFLNDQKFALLFIEEKIRLKQWGRNKLKGELLKRGLDRKLIDTVLDDYLDENEGISNALIIGRKKMNILIKRGVAKEKIREKTYAYLISKGYSFDDARETITELLKEETTF
jgi:regulatory protein